MLTLNESLTRGPLRRWHFLALTPSQITERDQSLMITYSVGRTAVQVRETQQRIQKRCILFASEWFLRH
jgi:hypothetical protein